MNTSTILYRHLIAVKSYFLLCLLISWHSAAFAQDFSWAKSLKGRGVSNILNLSEGSSTCHDIAIDNYENVYITGVCNDSVDFDPGLNNNFIVGGQHDIYIAKYNSDGELLWANVLQSVGGNVSNKIEIDGQNNIIIIGHCNNSVDFDPSSGVAELSIQPGAANFMFIAKYDSDGNYLWAKSTNGNFAVHGLDVSIDSNNEICATGSFYDSVDFDPSSINVDLISNGLAVFFLKYDSNGNLIWAKHISGIGNLGGGSTITCSPNNNILISGYFGGLVDFDPSLASTILNGASTAERFFAKYTSNGDLIWARNINVNDSGGLLVGRSISLAVDGVENTYVTGDYKGSVDFDPGLGFEYLTSSNGYSTFIGKYDSNGDFIWVKNIESSYCVSNTIELDCAGDIYISGVFAAADFDPSLNVDLVYSSAPSAFMNFFAKYDVDGNYLWARKIGNNGYGSGIIKSTIKTHNNDQYVCGAFKQSGDFDPGIDEYLLTSGGVGQNSFFAKYSDGSSLLGNDTILCLGETMILNATTPNATYIWQDNSTDSFFLVSEPGTYSVNITMGECSIQKSVNITYVECGNAMIQFPNVFTPNGDVMNDIFAPIHLNNILKFEFEILNRWGQKVFETKSKSIWWDGTSKGKKTEEGVYFWQIIYSDLYQNEYKAHGYLTLIR